MSSECLVPLVPAGCDVLYWPAGVNNRLPSGVNVRRRKNDVKVSLAYMLVFRAPSPTRPPDMLGEAEGMTAGRGMDGLGETERRADWPTCEPNDDRLLCDVGGGFMGNARDCGVPGADGRGEPSASDMTSCTNEARWLPRSGGAGLLEDIRRPGRSILATLLC